MEGSFGLADIDDFCGSSSHKFRDLQEGLSGVGIGDTVVVFRLEVCDFCIKIWSWQLKG